MTDLSFGILVQHALVVLLAVGMPLWDRYEIPRLKASTEPRKKVKYYWRVSALLWVLAVVSVLASGLITALTIQTSHGISWLEPGARARMFLEGLTAGILIAVFLPALLAVRSEKIRAKAGKAARKRLAFLLPSTPEERAWWWLVCLSAGICEEIVYRGFLLHYFHFSPFHLTWLWALVASSAIFGVGHLYQGIAGAVQTMVLGFIFGAIFLMTGTLLLPMVLHALLDLRVLVMLPAGFEQAEA